MNTKEVKFLSLTFWQSFGALPDGRATDTLSLKVVSVARPSGGLNTQTTTRILLRPGCTVLFHGQVFETLASFCGQCFELLCGQDLALLSYSASYFEAHLASMCRAWNTPSWVIVPSTTAFAPSLNVSGMTSLPT